MSKYVHFPSVVSIAIIIILLATTACSSPAPAAPTAVPTKAAVPAAAAPAPTSAPAAPAAAAPTAAPAAPAATAAPAAPAKVTEYNIVLLSDQSGPSADLNKSTDPARKVAVAYWNDTKGKELGVKVNLKIYDNRMDPSVTASLWPAALATDKPVAAIGQSASDAVALAQRLATDKVPLVLGSGGAGSFWVPDQWAFFAQSSYPHQTAGWVNWMLGGTWKESRPLRFGQISTQQVPSFADAQKGIQNFYEKGVFAGKSEYSGVEWVSVSQADVSNEVKRQIDKKTDYLSVFMPTPVVIATVRALQQYKAANPKLLFWGASGVTANAVATPLADFEGAYETSAIASSAETDIDAYKIYQQYKASAAGGQEWVGNSAMAMVSALLPLRAVERVAKAAGSGKVTGEAVYNAMYAGPFTSKDLLGLSGDLTYTKEAAFPISNLKARISTVKDGKFVLADTQWAPIPNIPKW